MGGWEEKHKKQWTQPGDLQGPVHVGAHVHHWRSQQRERGMRIFEKLRKVS